MGASYVDDRQWGAFFLAGGRGERCGSGADVPVKRARAALGQSVHSPGRKGDWGTALDRGFAICFQERRFQAWSFPHPNSRFPSGAGCAPRLVSKL